jgi:flavin-dependent dehydrogenase
MYDIIIIGAGLAGSSLATVLSRQGWHVALLERRHLPQHKVCGEFLSPESQQSLRASGLYETVANLSPALMDHALLVTPAGVRLRVALPGHAWGVSRFALDEALLKAAAQAGAAVQTGVTVTDVHTSGQGCTVKARTARGEEQFTARATVAACGRHPLAALRARSEQTQPDKRRSHVGVKCHYEGVAIPPQVELYLFPGGYAGLAPVEQGRVNLCLLATREAFAAAGGSVDTMLEAICYWNAALRRRLAGGHIVPDSRVAVAPVDTNRPAAPWEGMARVGDAVTMIPPLCGDGMAMALRSAELCAPLAHEFLSGQCSLAAWEQRYRQVWHQECDRSLLVGRWLQTMLSLPGGADIFLLLGNLMPFAARTAVHATRVPRYEGARTAELPRQA